jgi:hypothetical protein
MRPSGDTAMVTHTLPLARIDLHGCVTTDPELPHNDHPDVRDDGTLYLVQVADRWRVGTFHRNALGLTFTPTGGYVGWFLRYLTACYEVCGDPEPIIFYGG